MLTLRALLIDADPESEAGIEWSELLKGAGVHLSVASTADRALEILRGNREPEQDLVVLGPGLDDPAEVAGRLRRTLAERPLVILSREASDDLRRSLAAPTRLPGVRWTLIDLDSDRAEHRVRTALAAARDRRRLRTTLGRINTALSSQESAELSKLHRYTTSQRFHINIVRQSRDAVVATSPDGTIVAWNLAAEDLFGLRRDEAIGRHVAEVGNEAWKEMAASLPFGVTPSPAGDPGREAIDIRMAGRELEVTVSIVEGDDSVAEGIGLAIRDATARRTLERELAEARRLESLAMLAGGMAHVINNALTTVSANAEFLLLEDADDEEQAECLADIRDSARRAADLCWQMSALGGRDSPSRTRIDLGRFVREHEPRLRELLPAGVALKLETAGLVPPVLLDEAHIQQILENLVTNAAEATDEGGTVVIVTQVGKRTRTESSFSGAPKENVKGPVTKPPSENRGEPVVELLVRDDGCGMDEETRARAIEPFFSTKFTGRGLGLPVVLGLVRTHGGSVDIDSTPGEGTQVRMAFPVAVEDA